MAQDIFASNGPATTVALAKSGSPTVTAGTSETWTVASSTGFPAAATGTSQFRIADEAAPSEIMIVTNVSGTTWTVTRGAESTAPAAHSAGFTVYQALTTGILATFTQLAGDLGNAATSPQVTSTHLAAALPVNQGGTGSASRNFAGLLTPTAVKTGNYTAAAGDFVPCDSTSGAFTVTLPTAPADLAVVGIRHVAAGQTGGIAVTRGGSTDVLGKASGPATIQLPMAGNEVILQYAASPAVWYVIGETGAPSIATPQFQGYAAWTYDFTTALITTPTSLTYAAGKYYLFRLPVSGAAQFQTLNGNLSLMWFLSGTGAANAFFGLYGVSGTSATRLGSLTSDQSASTTGYLRLSLGSITSLAAYPQYYVGFVIGTQASTGAGPWFSQNSRNEPILNPGASAASVPSRVMLSQSTGNTTLPSSITLNVGNVAGTFPYPWFALD